MSDLVLVFAPTARLAEAEAYAGALRQAGARALVRAVEALGLTPGAPERCDRIVLMGGEAARVRAAYPDTPLSVVGEQDPIGGGAPVTGTDASVSAGRPKRRLAKPAP
jgi:hypothetical protein